MSDSKGDDNKALGVSDAFTHLSDAALVSLLDCIAEDGQLEGSQILNRQNVVLGELLVRLISEIKIVKSRLSAISVFPQDNKN